MKTILFCLISFVSIHLNANSLNIKEKEESSMELSVNDLFTISGTIYDLKGNEAIAGAVISIDGNSVYSDLWGNYTIMGIRKGNHTLIVNKLSYKEKQVDLNLEESKKMDIEIELDLRNK